MRVFQELTPECDYTTQLYASGYEKKEIADMKCRAVSTVSNQLQTAFQTLGIRNGRELTLKFAERVTGQNIRRKAIASVFILILLLDLSTMQSIYRIPRITRSRRYEQTY